MRNAAAIFCTAEGHVAENMSVWRSVRMCEQMVRMWGSKPRSSLRGRRMRVGQGLAQARYGPSEAHCHIPTHPPHSHPICLVEDQVGDLLLEQDRGG